MVLNITIPRRPLPWPRSHQLLRSRGEGRDPRTYSNHSADPDNEGDGDSLVRQAAIIALGPMGADAKTVIPALRNLIMDELTDRIYIPPSGSLALSVGPRWERLCGEVA